MRPLSEYATLVFDCDGVILDSNAVKTQAFADVASAYGADVSEAFVGYHVSNGGVSRYKKFSYLFSDILKREPCPGELDQLLMDYAKKVREGLLSCAVAEGLADLRKSLGSSRWLIASGGDQQELQEVFAERHLASYFDAGIFGSPTPKNQILSEVFSGRDLQFPALFIGDSRFDHVCAKEAALDFVFVSRWSEFQGWQAYCEREAIASFDDISAMARAGNLQ